MLEPTNVTDALAVVTPLVEMAAVPRNASNVVAPVTLNSTTCTVPTTVAWIPEPMDALVMIDDCDCHRVISIDVPPTRTEWLESHVP